MKNLISVIGICLILSAYGISASSSCCCSSSDSSGRGDRSSQRTEEAEETEEETPDLSEVRYNTYDLSSIRNDITANSQREEQYIDQGMILTGILERISNDSIRLSGVNEDETMHIEASTQNISHDQIVALSIGDKISIRGICTAISGYTINLDANEISVLQSHEDMLRDRIDDVLERVEETETITMEQLYQEARANPMTFENYQDRFIKIEGTLEHIDSVLEMFTVGDEGGNCDLECDFFDSSLNSQLTEFEIGQRIIVTGQVTFIVNANNNIDSDDFAIQFVEGFTDGLYGISADGFNMYFTTYQIEAAE